MDAPLYVTPFVWVMNKAKYDALSAAQKKVIDDHCTTEWAEKVASPGPTSSSPAAPSWPACRPRELQAHAGAAQRLAHGRRARRGQWADGVKKAGGDPSR
jgi:hypothetical protein